MKISKKYYISIGAILIISYVVIHVGQESYFEGIYSHINIIAVCIDNYIIENDGSFPDSEEELILKGFLKKEKSGYSIRNYDWRKKKFDDLENDEGWSGLYDFDLYTIRYGVKLDSMSKRNGIIYDKTTGKQIRLICGPHAFDELPKSYAVISTKWFDTMNKQRRKTDKKNPIISTNGNDISESRTQPEVPIK